MGYKIFVGSSSEFDFLAQSVLFHLQTIADVQIWNQNFFDLGKGTLETLVKAADQYDFAVFILAPDDELQYRGAAGTTPRANVLFELGLFMGALGSNRVFGMFSDQRDLFIPSDFEGVTVAKYESNNLDLKNYNSCEAATKRACDKIRLAILRYRSVPLPRSGILTDRTVSSISAYLAFKQEDVKIAVNRDDQKAIDQFDDDCHAVVGGSHIYESIKEALGTQIGRTFRR